MSHALPILPDAELALLGNVIRHPAWLEDEAVMAPLLLARYPAALNALAALHVGGGVVDFVTAGEAFAACGLDRLLAADAYERAADVTMLSALSALEAAAARRALVRLGEALLREADAERGPEPEILERLFEDFAALRQGQRLRHDLTANAVALPAYGEGLAVRRAAPTSVRGIATGFAPLDLLTRGFEPGHLIIMAARPSVGKSALAHQVVTGAAARGHGVLLATAEMSTPDVVERMVAQATGIAATALRSGYVSDPDFARVLDLARGAPAFDFYDAPHPLVADLRQLIARRAGGKYPVDLLCLDHLGWLGEKRDRGESTHELRGRQTKALKALARRYECAVLALCQLNRASEEGTTMRKPGLAELRESGLIEEDADVVLLLHRSERTARAGELIVAKHRNGPTGTVGLGWDGPATRWTEQEAA